MASQIEAIKKLYIQAVLEDGLSDASFGKLNSENKKLVEKKKEKYYLKKEFRKLFSVAMTGGVFDIIHPGHLYTLSEAKKHGDILIVAIATDETVKKIKKREPLHSQAQRCEMVNALKNVDLAIEGGADWKQTLSRVSPDVVVFGYDQAEKEISGVKTVKLKKFVEHENSKTGKIRDYLGI